MQKKYIILPIILTLFSLIFAGAPDTLWTRTYGGVDDDMGYSVQQTSDGGFIIAGETYSFGAGHYDVYLIRTNSSGDTLWTKTYGGEYWDCGKDVQQTNDSGFIIAGKTESFGAGLKDVYLIRTKSNGDTLWTKTYGGDSSDWGNSIQYLEDSGFVIVGVTQSFSENPCDIYLLRTELNGDTIWTKTYGGSGPDAFYRGNCVIQTNDGRYTVIGDSPKGGAGNSRIYLARITQWGDLLWDKDYGPSNSTGIGYSIQQTNDSGFIIAGEINTFNSNKDDACIIRTNSSAKELWTRTFGSLADDKFYSVRQTNDSGFICTGYFWPLTVMEDVYILKTDRDGDTLWTMTCGGTNNDRGYSIRQTNDGGFIIVGYTSSFGAGKNDVYLIRLDTEVGIQNLPTNLINPNDFIISYNHGNISIRYTIPYSTPVKLEAYDIKGKLVKVITDKFMHKGSYSVNWDSKRFGAGVYFVRLKVQGSEVSKKFIIIK